MWMFNLTSGRWTWLSGASFINEKGLYDNVGMVSENSRPGARQCNSMVMHPSGQSMFLFGGFGYDVNPNLGGLASFFISVQLNLINFQAV